MRQRRRIRVTSDAPPTGAIVKFIGVIHAGLGLTFVVLALTVILPTAGLIGLPFLLVGAFFAFNGIRMLLSKKDVKWRADCGAETDPESAMEEAISPDGEPISLWMMDRSEEAAACRAEDEAAWTTPAFSAGLSPEARMEQLDSLQDAGLLTREEYAEKRREILNGH